MAKQQWRHLLVNIAHGGFPADNGFIQPSNWSPKSESLFSFGCLYQHMRDIYPMKQVLNSCLDMISQELINSAIDQWSTWLLLVFRLQGGCTGHHFCNFSVTCTCKRYFCPDLFLVPVVHLTAATQRVFNCLVQSLPFLCYQAISGHFCENCVTLWLRS